MGNNRHIFNQDKASLVYAHVKPQVGNVNIAKPIAVKSHLALRATADLRKSRCAAYSYLIP